MTRLPRPIRARRAFTMLEMVVAITAMSIIAVAIFPVIASAADGYASATRARRETERLAFAAERCVRLLREAQGASTPGLLDIAVATSDHIEFADGRGLALQGTDLILLSATVDAPICRDVDAFVIEYLADDAITDTVSAPQTTQRFNVTITSGDITLSVSAFARTRIGT